MALAFGIDMIYTKTRMGEWYSGIGWNNMDKNDQPNKLKICYMCDQPATSDEHVPPKCFFPEQKDLGTENDYRKNLLTVPSCNKHNLTKSKDDEYLLFVIVSHYENFSVAQQHFSTKVMRAVRRRPSFYKFVATNYLISLYGKLSLAYEVDRDRFDRELDHITRALYYFHYKSKLNLPIIIFTPDLFLYNSPDSKNVNQKMQQIDKITIDSLSQQPFYGNNPEIFCYQFRYIDEIPSFILRMIFYGGFIVIAYASQSVIMNSSFS